MSKDSKEESKRASRMARGEARDQPQERPKDGSVSGESAEQGGQRGWSRAGEALSAVSPSQREDCRPGVCKTLEAIVRVLSKLVTGSDVPSGRITLVTTRTVRLLQSS